MFVARLKHPEGDLTDWEIIESESWHKAKSKATKKLLSYTSRQEYTTLILARARDFNVMEYCTMQLPYGRWSAESHGSVQYVMDKALPETKGGKLLEQN